MMGIMNTGHDGCWGRTCGTVRWAGSACFYDCLDPEHGELEECIRRGFQLLFL